MQTLKRKWQNFKTYRQLHDLWAEYKQKCSPDAFNTTPTLTGLESLSDFLDSFKTAAAQLEQSSGHEAQVDSIFGDCNELLMILLNFLKLFIEKPEQGALFSFFSKVFDTIELLSRTEKFKKTLEGSQEVLRAIEIAMENSEFEQLVVSSLKIIQNFSPQEKKALCRSGLVFKVLEMLSRPQEIYREALVTIRLFVETPTEEISNEGSFRKKLTRVIGGVTKLAWSFFPSEELSKSIDKFSDEPENCNFPPPESALRLAQLTFQSQFSLLEDTEYFSTPSSSPLKEELVAEEQVCEFLALKGTMSYIVKALQIVDDSGKAEMLSLAQLMLAGNASNQREFKKCEGYNTIREIICCIDVSTNEGLKRLENCFKVLMIIVLNGKSSQTVGNLQAFRLLLQIGASSSSVWVVKGALESLKNILNINWENVVCLYDQGAEYLQTILERNVVATDNPIVFCKEVVDIFPVFDDTLRFISFLLGNAREKNIDVRKIYSVVIQNYLSEIPNGLLKRLVLSLEGTVADINVRCSNNNALVRSAFLGCFEGMKTAANAALAVLGVDKDLGMRLIAHLLQYELLYTETLLNSPLTTDTQNTLFPFSLAEQFSEFFESGPLGKWIYEKYIVTKCGCEEIENHLFNLIEKGELLLVIKILMMEEYPSVDKFRAVKARERFLCEKGIKIIKSGLPATEYFWLTVASSKNSVELKYRLSTELDLKALSSSMPACIDSVNILLELSTVGGYLEISDCFIKIVSNFPNPTCELLNQVTQPRYLFNPVSTSRRSSTATSTVPLLDRSQLFNQSLCACSLVNGSYILALLNLIPACATELQSEILSQILKLSFSYHNKRVLCEIQLSKLLISLFSVLKAHIEICYKILESLMSYTISQEEALMLMDMWENQSIQQIISRCLSLDLHTSFYQLENSTLETPTITNFSKAGYSLMFWVRLPAGPQDLAPVFSWVDHNRGLVLFKLSVLQANGKKHSSMDYMKSSIINEPTCFVVQASTQSVFPSSYETSKITAGIISGWMHIAIVHNKIGVVLYVNNVQYPVIKCTNFASIREKYNVTGVFGSKSSKMMISSVVYMEGAVEASQVTMSYEKEPFEKCVFRLPEESSLQINYPNLSLSDGKWELRPFHVNNNLHVTSPVKHALGKISAISSFFSLLKTKLQPVALSFICELITQNSMNYKFFMESGGWSSLGGIVSKHDEFTNEESLEYIVSAILNKSGFHKTLKNMLVVKLDKIPNICFERIEGFSVLVELLAVLPSRCLNGVLDLLNKLFSVEDNARLFLSPDINGLVVILELTNSLVKEDFQVIEYLLLTIYEKILPFFSQDHLETFFEYLASPDLRQHFLRIEKTIESILSIFSVHLFAGNTLLLDKFMLIEGNFLLFEISKSQSVPIRCGAIRLIGLLLCISNKYRSWFLRVRGFDLLSTILQKQKPSKTIFELIILLSLNAFNNVSLLYPSDSSAVKMVINLSNIAAKALPTANSSPADKRILYVEPFEGLFEIIKLEGNESVKQEVFTGIEKLMEAENCEKVLDSAFLVWCSGLVKETQHLSIPQNKDSSNYQIFDSFVIKLCIFDLNRPGNKWKLIHWISRIPDADSFREKCLVSLLNRIKTNPNFEACDYVTNKGNFIKNLYSLLQNCELVLCYSEINIKVMHLINLLASCNTPAIRQQMKAVGYFDLRDDLIIQMLKEDLPQNILIEGIQCFSFETIASQPKFRDSNAVVYFIKFLIEFQSSPALQMEILNLIRSDICIHEENRKYLRKILENNFFLDFLAGFKNDDSNSIAQCFRSMKNLKLDEEGESFPENPTAEDFLTWLNGSEKAKKMIMVQVNKHLQGVEIEYKKNFNKAMELKAEKRKKTIDNLIKEKTSVQKMINELELKMLTRVTKAEERCTQRFQIHSSYKLQKLSVGARKSL